MASTTPKYGLRKPAQTDYVNVDTDISANMDLLDAHAHSGTYVGRSGGTSAAVAPLPFYNVKDYGALGDGTTDDTTAVQAAITATTTVPGTVYFPATSSSYKITSTLQVSARGLHFLGTGGAIGATTIMYTGTGSLFQIGTDNGHAYDAADYDGYANTTFEFLALQYSGTYTPLANGFGLGYGAGTYAVRDWRGGQTNFRSCFIQRFAYGFWGIQSDFNTWVDTQISFCHVGAYLGPRSDQFNGLQVYFVQCDTAVEIDAAWQPRFYGSNFVDNGAASINPIKIHAAWARGTQGAVFSDCWFEHLTSSLAYSAVEAFVEVGVGDTNPNTDIVFRNSNILNNASGTPPRVQYFAKIGNGDRITVDGMYGSANQFDNILRFVGTTNPNVTTRFDHSLTLAAAAKYSNGGSGTPTVTGIDVGLGRFGISTGQGRESVRLVPGTSPSIQFIDDQTGNQHAQIQVNMSGSVGQILLDTETELRVRDGTNTYFHVHAANNLLDIGRNAATKIGFFGAAAAAQPAGSTDLRTALNALGLVPGTTNPLTVIDADVAAGIISGYKIYDPDQLATGESTMRRRDVTSAISTGSTTLRLAYFTAKKTETITQVRIITGSTAAAATPTICRIGVWTTDGTGALLSQVATTPNDTTLFAAANTAYTKSFSVSFSKTAGQRYAVGVLVVSGVATPNIQGNNFAGILLASETAQSPMLSSTVTGQSDLPSTVVAGSLTQNASAPYMVLLP